MLKENQHMVEDYLEHTKSLSTLDLSEEGFLFT